MIKNALIEKLLKTALCMSLVTGTAAIAQEWPVKTITFLNPFPAGGGTDAFARPLSCSANRATG
jgi:tripartite-type tricarboxylate transporter receptor subunit TctC